MAMTSIEMIEFFGQQAARTRLGMAAAQSSSNYQLASMNCRQAFKCRLMQGLISWRMAKNPTDFFIGAVQSFSDDWKMLISIGGETTKLSDTPAERVPFISCLIGQQDLPNSLSTDGLEGDRLLDAVLGKWLFGSWDDTLWEQGIGHLRSCGSQLALDTYDLYKSVVHASSADLPALMEKGESLFGKRKTDEFFSGGDQTEGGSDDNDFTVDYRLASLAKCVGYEGKATHAWRW